MLYQIPLKRRGLLKDAVNSLLLSDLQQCHLDILSSAIDFYNFSLKPKADSLLPPPYSATYPLMSEEGREIMESALCSPFSSLRAPAPPPCREGRKRGKRGNLTSPSAHAGFPLVYHGSSSYRMVDR